MIVLIFFFPLSLPSVLEEELVSIDEELQVLEIQIEELLERQQELINKKKVLKRKIKQFSDDSEAGGSQTNDSAKSWDKQGLQNQIQLLISPLF